MKNNNINKIDVGKQNLKNGNDELDNYQQQYVNNKLDKFNYFKALEGDKHIYNLYLNQEVMNKFKAYSLSSGVPLSKIVLAVLKDFIEPKDE